MSSTVAGMYFVNDPERRGSPPEHSTASSAYSMADPDNHGNNLSDDDNTSCSNSELGSEISSGTMQGRRKDAFLSSTGMEGDNNNSGCGRRNKRKNFLPRNIVEYAGSDEDDDHHHHREHGRLGSREIQLTHDLQRLSPPDSGSIQSPVEPEDNSEDEDDEEEEDDVRESPLDLSEVQNRSKRLWRKPDEELLGKVGDTSYSHTGNSYHQSSPGRSSDLLLDSTPTQFLPFSPVDLTLPAYGTKFNSTDTQSGLHRSGIGALHPHHIGMVNGSNHHPIISSSPSSVLSDFAKSTMKELIGLYGIAENIQPGGNKPCSSSTSSSSIDIPSHHPQLNINTNETTASSSPPPESNKQMILPENLARLLAAMQESVAVSNSTSPSNNASTCVTNNGPTTTTIPNPSPTNHHQPHSVGGSRNSTLSHHNHHHPNLKAQLSNNNLINNNNGNNNNNNNQSENRSVDSPSPTPNNRGTAVVFGPSRHLHHHHHHQSHHHSKIHHHSSRSRGKPAIGRGLNTFPVIREGLLGKGSGPVDYTRYVRRYGSFSDCGYGTCRDFNYREHFHCLECSNGARVFVKKEEMIRHFKWHKKRDESLQHGFMRYSPSDDCTDRFGHCPHNRKQTHYHCLQDSCEKVYISTSDVQMHANYHRKDSAIIQEGFQRFRAAEDCATDHCSFRHQHTTHFHCRRSTCSYTFKNKADMEKHKSYHMKDEQLNRDGFKKYMKHEVCRKQYPNCRFSTVCNHIHCIRDGCNYVLHSSGQLYSHKRKHERRDSELAYRKFKLAQSLTRGTLAADLANWNSDPFLSGKYDDEQSRSSSINESIGEEGGGVESIEDAAKKYVQICKCDISPEEHYHCRAESCINALLGNAEVASEHSRSHELENRISSLAYFTVDPANFDAQDKTIPCISAKCVFQDEDKHHHCLWDGCSEVILETDEPFRRLEHFREHERTQKLDVVPAPPPPALPEKVHNENLDGFFRRKRGRPPKNRVIEVASGASNEAIFTSFKLPKPRLQGDDDLSEDMMDTGKDTPIGFNSYPESILCPNSTCPLNGSSSIHYHCGHPRCHFSVGDIQGLSIHLRDFHTNVDVREGYEYFDKSLSDCHESNCQFRKSFSHYHCVRDGYGFTSHSKIPVHEAKCHNLKVTNGLLSSDDDERSWIEKKAAFSKRDICPVIKSDPMDLSSPNGILAENISDSKHMTDHSLNRILQLPTPETESSEIQFGPSSACGRPFCKLKRKNHFHCHLCNQAFSDLDKLRPHVLKHNNLTQQKEEQLESNEEKPRELPPVAMGRRLEDDNEKFQPDVKSLLKRTKEDGNSIGVLLDSSLQATSPGFPTSSSFSGFLGYPPNPSPYLLFPQNPLTLYAGMVFGNGGHGGFPQHSQAGVLASPPPSLGSLSDPKSPGVLNTKRPSSSCSSPTSPPTDSKKQRLQLRILKDEPVPEGYVRFRFNEDCNFHLCGYREHQTHFHCIREECGYSFCDKTRFVQHTARHERLDTLMGGDFKQYRFNFPCGRPSCPYQFAPPGPNAAAITPQGQQNKQAHFHCSKCDFMCTDTNKVVAHRRQHQKLDSINAAGFEKYTPSQNCLSDGCLHAQKQTHYHCLKCSYAVLGLSQMSAHKYRHME